MHFLLVIYRRALHCFAEIEVGSYHHQYSWREPMNMHVEISSKEARSAVPADFHVTLDALGSTERSRVAEYPTLFEPLSFMTNGAWTPIRSGNYGTDCTTGRAAAQELLQAMTNSGSPLMFGTVAQAIAACDAESDGVEIGFYSIIGLALIGQC
jgi:hypothetical protein